MVNFGLLTVDIYWRVWDTPAIFQRVSRLGSVTAQRAPPIFCRAAMTMRALAHTLVIIVLYSMGFEPAIEFK